MLLRRLILVFIFTLVCQGVYSQKEYRLNKVKFVGNKLVSNEKLLNQINTQPKKNIEKLMFWKKSPDFISFVLENDISRLTQFYNKNGFLNPKIYYEIDTIRLHKINVIIHVTENEYVKVNNVNINIKGDSLTGYLNDQISSKILIKKDDRFVDDKVYKSEANINQTFANNGYPFSKSYFEIDVLENKTLTDITFNVETGKKSYIGDISIYGDSLVPQNYIYKNIDFKSGDLYNQQLLDRTQQKIFNTELFQYVIVRSLKDSVSDNKVPIEVYVRELNRWILELGLGYGTDDRLRLSLMVTRLNFLGGARKLILKAKTSYYTPYNFDLKFIQPDLFIHNLDLIVNPFYVQEREKSYEIERLGGGVSLQYPLSKKLNSRLTYSFEKDNILEISNLQLDETEIKHNKSLVSWGMQYNSTKNILNPTNGTKVSTNIGYSGLGHKAVYHYYKFDLQVRNYIPLSTEVNLATKLKTGVMQAVQNDPETPIEDRYFAGGASSLRGWGRHEIYPMNIDSTAIGGNTLFEGSVELRFPIYDILRGAVFIDFGNVWAESYRYDVVSLHYNIGIGVRVKTPIGPVRLDMATPIINDDPGFQFFISVGHAF